jgi:hypothetical protein
MKARQANFGGARRIYIVEGLRGKAMENGKGKALPVGGGG